jgi:A-macroglobulin receptor binding domain
MQGGTGSKTGGDQSEKGDVKRAHRDATMISRMLGTFALSARTEFSVTTGLAYQIVGRYYLPWDEKAAGEPLSIDVAYDRTRLAQDDIATARATVKNNLPKAANMVMVDLGIPPGFDLLSEDLQDYQQNSAHHKSGHLSKFSLTATQALLYFDSFAPGEVVTLKYRLRAKYPIRVRTFKSQGFTDRGASLPRF